MRRNLRSCVVLLLTTTPWRRNRIRCKAKANYYKAANEKRGKELGRGKPYNKRGKKVDEGGSGGKGKGDGNCFRCGLPGHRFFECP
ncbi:cellular nucleic acid-binding protein, partial [Trifolium medium]|nr:cellular nucleic acid-binding protein [Trifolium medium]